MSWKNRRDCVSSRKTNTRVAIDAAYTIGGHGRKRYVVQVGVGVAGLVFFYVNAGTALKAIVLILGMLSNAHSSS